MSDHGEDPPLSLIGCLGIIFMVLGIAAVVTAIWMALNL
jgi:hypothetical protein